MIGIALKPKQVASAPDNDLGRWCRVRVASHEREEAGGPGTEPTGSRGQGCAAVLQPKDMNTSNYTPQDTHSCNSSESLF